MSRIRSLAQQLIELSDAAPVDFDPEDVLAGVNPEDEPALDNSAARDHYVDVAPSTLRKLNQAVSDPKYEGVRATRKQLFENANRGTESESEASSMEDESVPRQSGDEGQETEDEDSSGDSNVSSHTLSEDEGPRRDRPSPDTPSATALNEARNPAETEHNDDLAFTLRRTREEDREKGKAVARQIGLWDNLLDARIQLQKVVTTANRLPEAVHLAELMRHQPARDSLETMFREAEALTEELFALQEGLLERNESIAIPPRKRRRIATEEEMSYDHSAYLGDLSSAASALEASYHSHLVHTLAKWSAKVQAVAPSVLLGNRNAFSKDTRNQNGVVGMVDDILRTDASKLLSRTRTRKSKGKRLGSTDGEGNGDDAEKEDTELFDDLDFYQQLLRDVIRARGSDSQGGEQDWMAHQRERKAKHKQKIDTKASKGRKLRYEVHPKLQNFMVSVPVTHGWHEEQIDGLFSSLLGAG
ncbi:TRAUB-domain-containing protein [Laetiporus sulphureus 93-53]|uniref:Protein BFR2 n=1 Tax=Laetiporus sulphureus 93-53 TaxID=1314785 RepID=A0A165G6X0_9APHY|nr:TRAUB-domain-containing protein [Laetiporus sulphureus 93-53]KZT09910.1 TRAUB-domain-containing protein [Laetiporus sulphureus 93-53]